MCLVSFFPIFNAQRCRTLCCDGVPASVRLKTFVLGGFSMHYDVNKPCFRRIQCTQTSNQIWSSLVLCYCTVKNVCFCRTSVRPGVFKDAAYFKIWSVGLSKRRCIHLWHCITFWHKIAKFLDAFRVLKRIVPTHPFFLHMRHCMLYSRSGTTPEHTTREEIWIPNYPERGLVETTQNTHKKTGIKSGQAEPRIRIFLIFPWKKKTPFKQLPTETPHILACSKSLVEQHTMISLIAKRLWTARGSRSAHVKCHIPVPPFPK